MMDDCNCGAKVLGFVDVGSLGSGIKEAPKDGVVYGRRNGEWAEVSDSNAVDYSLEEQYSGRKWIDGKKIYIKTIEVNWTTTQYESSFTELNIPDIDKILDYTGGFYTSADIFFSLGYTSPGGNPVVGSYIEKEKFGFRHSLSPSSFPLKHVYATLYYTCTDR